MRKLDSTRQDLVTTDHVFSLLRRLRLDWLLQHFPSRLVRSVYVFVNGFITIALLALLALVSGNPFVFPSLGPTAYLLFFSPHRWPLAFIHQHHINNLFNYALLLPIVAYDLWSTGRIQRVTVWASLYVVVVQQLRIPIGQTAAWHAFAAWAQSLHI